ncbi:hypothetical protein ACFQZ2_20485, partial [Streptomonospora algeriensis]
MPDHPPNGEHEDSGEPQERSTPAAHPPKAPQDGASPYADFDAPPPPYARYQGEGSQAGRRESRAPQYPAQPDR